MHHGIASIARLVRARVRTHAISTSSPNFRAPHPRKAHPHHPSLPPATATERFQDMDYSYGDRLRTMLGSICGTVDTLDDDVDTHRKRLILGEEEELPPEASQIRAPYISPVLLVGTSPARAASSNRASSSKADSAAAPTPQPATAQKVASDATSAQAGAGSSSGGGGGGGGGGDGGGGDSNGNSSGAAGDTGPAAAHEGGSTLPDEASRGQSSGEAAGADAAEPEAENTGSPSPALASSMADLMAEVTALEEQGLLVEASAVMARGLAQAQAQPPNSGAFIVNE